MIYKKNLLNIISNNPDKVTLIENFSSHRLEKYEKAIELYSKIDPNHGLSISNITYDIHGRRYYGSYSLHIAKRPKDLYQFWDIYKSL